MAYVDEYWRNLPYGYTTGQTVMNAWRCTACNRVWNDLNEAKTCCFVGPREVELPELEMKDNVPFMYMVNNILPTLPVAALEAVIDLCKQGIDRSEVINAGAPATISGDVNVAETPFTTGQAAPATQ